MPERKTREIRIGNIRIGGSNPIAVQSMTATKTQDIDATIRQVELLEAAGADVIRIAVDTARDVTALAEVRNARPRANLVIDLQENYRLAEKVARLRVFENAEGKFDRSLLDTGGEALVISQFTLLGDASKGNRPSFTDAAPPEEAEPLYEAFCASLRELGVPVATGEFAARMAVELVNDGPVTILL